MIKTFAASVIATLAAAQSGKAMIGTNIGGWMVLEPWITPSLFYRFLGNTHTEGVGMDTYTFCESLGAEEGNKVLRDHWDTWITEDVISDLADREVEVVRVPIGDWTFREYGPYVNCTTGALDKITWLMDTCATYGIKVLLDVHAMKDSQNGFDNSGQASNLEWTDETHFKHWSVSAANWMGTWNVEQGYYENMNRDNIDWAIDNVTLIMQKWGDHPALYAVQPLNEPWWSSDLNTLKYFYQAAREEVRAVNSDTLFVFHDSFHSDGDTWNDLFPDQDMANVVMDTHQYMAWWGAQDDIGGYCDAYGTSIRNVASSVKYPIWVGEWSLATDVCAMWLGGFNDSNTEYQRDCEWVDCPVSYLSEANAVDFDRTAATLGPWGESDRAMVKYGQCARDSTYFSEDDMQILGDCTSFIFDDSVQGQFLWNAKNELEDRWSYINAYDKGWLTTRLENKQFMN